MGLFDSLFGGGNKSSFTPSGFQSSGQDAQNYFLSGLTDPNTGKLANDYSQGKISLNELQDKTGTIGTAAQAVYNPYSGSKMATEQVQNNGILGGLYGEGGQLSQAEKQATDLSNRGYSLQPEDYEAYGQASNNIARQFGQTEQGLSASLASRGMGQAGGGAAQAQFSGVYGNKNEQLGQMQQQIAQSRMTNNLQRLSAMQNYVTQLGAGGANAIQQQYGRNVQGVQGTLGAINDAYKNDIGLYGAQNAAEAASAKSKQDAEGGGGLGDALSGGIMAGVTGLGAGLVPSGSQISQGLGSIFGGGSPAAAGGSAPGAPKISPQFA